MIYSIIPPILIVISLAGIVIFLIKKAPEVASLELERDLVGKKSLWAKITRKKESTEEGKDLKHKLLLFLEKITKKLKLLFLKLENVFNSWGESFRNKRQTREEEKMAQLEEMVEKREILKEQKLEIKEDTEEEGIMSIRPIQETTKSTKPVQPAKPVKPVKPIKTTKPVQPIQSIKEEKKEKIKLRVKKEKKELLENILVERIATNPRDLEAYEQLGEYYLDLGQWDYAKECFKQVLKINPKRSSVKKKMKKLEKMFGE